MSLSNVGAGEQLVVFTIGTDEFGISIQLVREIIKEAKVVRVPNMPAHVKGVLNLRGLVIPIVDLAEQLGVEAQNNGQKERKILIVERGDTQVGYLVNAVSEVLSVPRDALEAPRSSLGSLDHSVVASICKLGERLFPVLNMSRLLGEGELEALDEMGVGSQQADAN